MKFIAASRKSELVAARRGKRKGKSKMDEQRKKEQEESDLLVPDAVKAFITELYQNQQSNKMDGNTD